LPVLSESHFCRRLRLPDAMHVNGERMNLAYAVSILIGHRDFVRRMAAETGLTTAA
jgi:hypothetical protein